MPTLKENLEAADSAVRAAQTVKPEAKELDAIRKFCNEEVAHKKRVAEVAETLKTLRATQKALKSRLLEAIKASGSTCFALSKDDAKRLEKEASAAGLPQVPPFARLVQTNKDATITSEVIQEALAELTLEDITEAKGDGREALKNAVMQNVRRTIRSFTESVRLMTSLPRGSDHYDVPETPEATVEIIWSLWTTEQTIKKHLDAKKQDPETAQAQAALKETIEAFFVRTGLTAQRLVVEGAPYRLVRRVSVRKPKIGIGKLEPMLDKVLRDIKLEAFRPVDVIRGLQIQLASVPSETKTSVSLCAVKKSAEE